MVFIRTLSIVLVLCAVALAACKKEPKLPPEQVKMEDKLEGDTGLPVPLLLPEHGETPQDLDLIPPTYGSGTTTWEATFIYAEGFEKVVASFDKQLKPQGFSRLGGPLRDADPGFKIEDPIKPPTARGKKAWIAGDRKIAIMLTYEYEKATQPGAFDAHNYQLNAIRWDEPQEVKPPSTVAPIP
jgi:hypothetical protein